MKVRVRRKKVEPKHAVVGTKAGQAYPHDGHIPLCGEEKPWFLTSYADNVTCEGCLVALDRALEEGVLELVNGQILTSGGYGPYSPQKPHE